MPIGPPRIGDLAPELTVSQWFNTDQPITLQSLRGKVVVIEAFQMLCPGCVAHGIPQASNIAAAFSSDDVTVLGLHTVFEHHEAMTPVSLKAFLHEYRVRFPVGIDEPSESHPTPITMTTYALRGTPSMIILDREGVIRAHTFGATSDLQVGALLGSLLAH
jgi:peroxiredoxin